MKNNQKIPTNSVNQLPTSPREAGRRLWVHWHRERLQALSYAPLGKDGTHNQPTEHAALLPQWSSQQGWQWLKEFLAQLTPDGLQGIQVPWVTLCAWPHTGLPQRPDIFSNPSIEFRTVLTAEDARCARLRRGGVRVYVPEPNSPGAWLLLVHEMGHALLEFAQPGSLEQTKQTETLALALERLAGHWLAQQDNSPPVHAALRAWLSKRRRTWLGQNVRAAQFEARVARACYRTRHPPAPDRLQAWWREVHPPHTCSTSEPCCPDTWWRVPALYFSPGSLQHSVDIWRSARTLARQPAQLVHHLSGARNLTNN